MGAEITGSLKKYMDNPDLFKQYAEQAYGNAVFPDAGKMVEAAGGEVKNVTSNRMTYTIKRMSNRGVVDLKPFFAASPKAKRKKDGGWYLVVPIHKSTRDIQSQYGRKYYDTIRSQVANGKKTVNPAQILKGNMETIKPLQYTPKSQNITATKSKNGGSRNGWVMFRTVSDKSAPESWVMGRSNLQEDNTSETLQRDIATLMRNRAK